MFVIRVGDGESTSSLSREFSVARGYKCYTIEVMDSFRIALEMTEGAFREFFLGS